jgi:threonine dehydratase
MLEEIRAAATRLKGVSLRTPLLPIRDGLFIKPESLQPTGSFKIRGAYNALSLLSDEARTRGVVAHSSGNHGQAVARAARLLGIRAVVVMPNNAPDVKVAGVRGDGAEIIFVGPHNEERVARAHEIADRDGMTLVPSANLEAVMAGQGTIGLEIHEQLAEAGIGEPDEAVVVVAPVGLGGLAAGISAAFAELRPAARVMGAEPVVAADTRDSLAAGVRTAWPAEETARTIADGLRGEMPAELPFEIMRRHVAGVITVEESEIVSAMKVAAREARLVVEPSGAVSLAAVLFHRREVVGQGPVVVVASGGNVDPQRYVEWLSTPD